MSSRSWQWQATVATITALAGVGVGYLLGLISAKWLRKVERRALEAERLHEPPTSTSSSSTELAAALAQLTAEVAQLRQAIQAGGLELASRRSMRTADSIADFVSAQGDVNPEPEIESEEEEAFFDIAPSGSNTDEDEDEKEPAAEGGHDETVQFDQLGKRTQESEEVCTDLLERLKTCLEERSADVGLLWRLARAEVHLSMHHERRGDSEEEKALLQEALEHARLALEGDSTVWQGHQWYAIALGALSKSEGIQQRIKAGHEYKEHIDIALSLHSEECTLHYLKGRWCYEVAGVSWLEKKAAAALFGSPPESTYNEALACFMTAKELSSHKWKENMLMIAKLGDVPTALEWLHKALNLPTKTSEDAGAEKEIRELLEKHDETFTV